MQGQGKSQQPWGQCPSGLRLRKRWPRRLALRLMALVWGGLVVMGLLVMPGHAQGSYPPQLDPFLNDYAGLVTPEDAAAIRQLYGDLKQTTGIDAVAVTIQSLAIYETGDQTIESFATNLFNTWEIGDRDRNDWCWYRRAIANCALNWAQGLAAAMTPKCRRSLTTTCCLPFEPGTTVAAFTKAAKHW